MPFDIDHLSFRELLKLNRRVVARLKFLESAQAHLDMMAFNLGAQVSFETQEGRQLGILVNYNRKTVRVLTESGQRWNVSRHLLSPVRDAAPTQPRAAPKKKRLKGSPAAIAVRFERLPRGVAAIDRQTVSG